MFIYGPKSCFLVQLSVTLVLMQWSVYSVFHETINQRLSFKDHPPLTLTSDARLKESNNKNHGIEVNVSIGVVSLLPPMSSPALGNNRPYFVPIVIFCSYRVRYTDRLLRSLKITAAQSMLDVSSPCLFVLHQNEKVQQKDIIGMKTLLNKISFCKVIRNVVTTKVKRTASTFKRLWYETVESVFENNETLSLGSSYQKDIIFLEDDIVLSPDALQAFQYGTYAKNRRNNVVAVGLGGWSGENVINAHPDTFIARRSFHFPSMAYAFNKSLWTVIKHSEMLWHRRPDWSEALGSILNRRRNQVPYYMVPTLGRVWHIGSHGLGLRGDSSIERHVELRAHWTKSPRLIDLNQASVNSGYRDLFGFFCGDTIKKSPLCPGSFGRFPAGRRFDIICIDAGKGREPCWRNDPFLERDFSVWLD